jgi:predicted O-linked N-acetylglucosamine transferase (SPINDLY family)
MLAKISRETLHAWATILHAMPDARLMLKAAGLNDEQTIHLWKRRFVEQGISPGRIILRHRTSTLGEHLAMYSEIDIALDTFPYNGTTTTCEALWMGVPVVTLAGRLHAGRVGVSLLNQVGHPEWIADSRDAYVAIACALARDPARLAAIRAGLRTELLASPLCDAQGFTRRLENALREMWVKACTQAA